MTKPHNILIVTSRNAYSTSGELRLIKNRLLTLKNSYDIETNIINLIPKSKEKLSQEDTGADGYQLVLHHWTDFFFKSRKSIEKIKSKITSGNYSLIILSGVLISPLVKRIRRLNAKVQIIADLHGAYEELIEFKTKSTIKNIIRVLYYKYAKRIERKYLPEMDGYLVVSNSLKSYIKDNYHIVNDNFFKVPCAIQETGINLIEAKKNRDKYRGKYGIKDDELLFIYSGGVSPWQCIEESVCLFNKVKQQLTKNAKLLLMSGNLNSIQHFRDDDIIIDSYVANEVRNVLCAGDYAFLLRDDMITNNVAYPNKFLEYIASGLKVISTPYVFDVAEQIQSFDLGICISYDERPLINYLNRENTWLADLDRRNMLLQSTSFQATLKPLVEFINE